ncbi:MAG: DUF4384 domain-containing protein [Bacteroidetes bacterium]|nr:DUF4384 domain-containing protein [Bacteroidota bacterium]
MKFFKHTKSVLLLVLGLALIFSAYTGKDYKEIKLKNIQGVAVGGESETLEHVKIKAINNAKIEALRKAGIEENINSYSNLFKSEDSDNYEELFSSNVFSNIRGSVKDIEIRDLKKEFTPEGQMKVTVVINCVVIKYKTISDLTFDAWVDGFKLFYNNEEAMEFTVKPSQDAYLRAFLITTDDAYVLFPNDYEKSFILEKDTEYPFPSQQIEYILTSEKKSKVHRVIVVLLKKDIPYTEEVTYKNITKWIFNIPPDERVVKSFGFSVVENN